jgi:predicted small lipoprotein YifL
MNSQPKIVVTSTVMARRNARQAGLGIANQAVRRACQAAGVGLLGAMALLAGCGQKGPLYLPDNPPASHRHGASAKPAESVAPGNAASSASSTTPPAQP